MLMDCGIGKQIKITDIGLTVDIVFHEIYIIITNILKTY